MDKYFIPKIEDIHVGYECQFCNQCWSTPLQSDLVVPEPKNQGWWNIKITTDHDFEELEWLLGDSIRTPYLTKEQIEAEGWEESNVNNFFSFKNNDRFYVSWYPEMNRIEFGDDENEIGFAGTCPSINEFRTICKLLNIK